MSREEAIEKLKIVLKGRKDKRGKTETAESLEMAIKALEKEPTDTWSIKEVVDTFKKHGFLAHNTTIKELNQKDVLDKIKAEIEAKCCITVGRENDGAITLHDVFEIIDKYKAGK